MPTEAPQRATAAGPARKRRSILPCAWRSFTSRARALRKRLLKLWAAAALPDRLVPRLVWTRATSGRDCPACHPNSTSTQKTSNYH
eukprot:2378556-Amphidinium_carterae.1